MPEFSINEYVWDKVREAPAVVIGDEERAEGHPYMVAEIVSNPFGNQTLGRIAHRTEADLCYYAKVVMPEDEVKLLLTLLGVIVPLGSLGPEAAASFERIKEQADKRGIAWSQ